MRITRYKMYKSIFAALTLPMKGKILGISGLKYFKGSKNYSPPFPVIAPESEIVEADFPHINVCALPYEDSSFDYVICDQVLEHVEGDVQKAVNEIHRVLNPEGTAIITSVFIQPIHWGPKDLWRFSPDALRYLCKDFSSIIECNSWGNRWAHILFFLYRRSRDWQVSEHKFSLMRSLATHNDSLYPMTTWIVAKK